MLLERPNYGSVLSNTVIKLVIFIMVLSEVKTYCQINECTISGSCVSILLYFLCPDLIIPFVYSREYPALKEFSIL